MRFHADIGMADAVNLEDICHQNSLLQDEKQEKHTFRIPLLACYFLLEISSGVATVHTQPAHHPSTSFCFDGMLIHVESMSHYKELRDGHGRDFSSSLLPAQLTKMHDNRPPSHTNQEVKLLRSQLGTPPEVGHRPKIALELPSHNLEQKYKDTCD